MGVDGTELRLASGEGERRLPLAGLVELRRADGTKRRTLQGAMIGYVVGAAAARVAIGNDSRSIEDDSQSAMLIAGMASAAVGALVGHTRRDTRWTVVSPTVVRHELLPGTRLRIQRTPVG